MAKTTKIDLIKLDPNDPPKESPPDPEGQETKAEERVSWIKKILPIQKILLIRKSIFSGVKKVVLIKKSIFLLGLVTMVLLGGAAVVGSRLGWLPIPGLSAGPKPGPKAEPPPAVEKQEMGQVVKLSSLVTNLKEENGRNYLKTTIVLEVEKKGEVEEIQSKMSILMDAAILTLSDKRLEDLKQPEAKDHLKQELLTKMNQHLEPKRIKRIYFDEFLYQ
jgi:flagellar basal body-associated protein FliL